MTLEWVMFALSTPVVLWAAWPFHRAAFQAARHGGTTMDTLVSLGVLAAYMWSLVAIFSHGHVYFEVAVTVTTFLLAGSLCRVPRQGQRGPSGHCSAQDGGQRGHRSA
jgi:cation transport ATPase